MVNGKWSNKVKGLIEDCGCGLWLMDSILLNTFDTQFHSNLLLNFDCRCHETKSKGKMITQGS
jgi:hypothetical protein